MDAPINLARDARGESKASSGDARDAGQHPAAEAGEAGVACVRSAVVLGGQVAGASTLAFGATLRADTGWNVATLPTNVVAPPAVVPYDTGFLAAFVDTNGGLDFATSTWGWGSPATISKATAQGSPSLAVVGMTVHLAYQGSNGKYYHGTYSPAAGWDGASDPVGGTKQGFGPAAPVAAAIGGALVIAYGGQDGALYDETWTAGGGWAPDNEHASAQVGKLAPAIVALEGGASDALIVYVNPAGTLYFTARSGASWSAPTVISTSAFTNAAVSLAPLTGARAMMTYLGTNGLPYFSVYDPTTTPEWTAPAALGAGATNLSSPPSVASGVCGDDAVAVLVSSTGAQSLGYAAGTWSAPSTLPGTAGMAFASVAAQASAAVTAGQAASGDGGSSPSTPITVDPQGNYQIGFESLGWTFSGALHTPATQIANASGSDSIGTYKEVTFSFDDTSQKTASIRRYDLLPVALLSVTYVAAAANSATPFPTFTRYPELPHHASYSDTEFGPVSFDTLTADSPFVFFDDNASTFVLSAASDFMNAATIELAGGALAAGIDPAVTTFPAGFTHRTLLVAESGINAAYATWGSALLSLSGKTRVASDATPYLSRMGYWTDNGAYYYYNYDTTTGYPATLASVRDSFTQLGMPLAYVQLDSWWYPKGPERLWSDKANGQYTYTADTTLLPEGLPSLHQSLALPLVTHARWIDPSSPYAIEYTMSGHVSTDPAYWAETASYLAAGGVTVYEQDWLNQNALPTTTNLTDQGTFMDGMAGAMATAGIDVQYCMPLPRHYLQGSKYPNVTTTRVSVDRFSRPRYEDFLFTSLLTSSLGAWPWVDTFNSPEMDNLLLATLSAGMVGIGDQVGSSSISNLLQAARPDGVIVKPDAPIVPLDETFLRLANGVDAPLVGATYSDFGSLRASYVYAFNVGTSVTAAYTPASLGYSGQVFIWSYFAGTGVLAAASATYTEDLTNGSLYDIVVPVGASGMALVGDRGKFVSLGKKRFTQLVDTGTMTLSLSFAAEETSVTLHGYANSRPTATASVGSVGVVTWSASTHLFTLEVMPSGGVATIAMQ